MKKISTILIVFVVAVIISGCVTQKKKGEDMGPVKKLYNNVTAEFNGYFNADVIMMESIAALDDQYQDNYNKVLPVYKYVAADNPQAVAGELDEAIKKVSVVVNLHPYSDWVDDCYLLVGQAQYLKKDYESAEETFEYLVEEYNPRAMEKRKERAQKVSSAKKGSKSTSSNKAKAKSKKDRQKAAKKAKKEREKERKKKNKEIQKNRKRKKKGKSTTAPKKTTPKKDDQKDDTKIVEEEVEEERVPTQITLGNLEPTGVDGKPENYFMKHRPAYQEAILWLARAYIERENYTYAERFMDQLDESGGTQKDVRAELAVVQAHYYLKRKQYDKAMEPLEKAISLAKDKLKKARYAFIVGQLYQNNGQSEEAFASFERVVKYGPDYEMAFSAKLAMAQNQWLTGKGTPEQAMKNLEKMLKDFKNIDFQDRIYFAMAEIALKQDHLAEAISYYKKSAWYNIGNETQKAESYYQLASLYYESEDYVNAKYYFDSTLAVMNKKDERYEPSERLKLNLTDIAQNIEIINLQDSLLRIAQMTEEEQKILAAKIKAKKAEDERARAKLAAYKEKQRALAKGGSQGAAGVSMAGNKSAPSSGNVGNATSDFFAFDDRKVKRGVREFQRAWGTRPLEDSWRRSSQQSFADNGEPIEAAQIAEASITDDEIKSILRDVPKTEEEVAAAHRAIENAMYSLGSLYRDRLQRNEKSIEILEDLIRRYPDTQYQLDALYFLYLANTDLPNVDRANYYKNKIINEYPTSTYAKVLLDPSFVNTLLSDEQKLNQFYDETYAQFTSGNYQQTYDRIGQVGQKFGSQHNLQPRFALLSAMCTGNIQGKEKYVENLNQVIAQFPDTPEATRAKEILRLLDAKQASGPGQNRPNLDESKFTFEAEKLHYMIVVFDGEVNLNDAKVGVSDYNRNYHKLDKLRISNIYLGNLEEKVPIIVIRRFKDLKKAMGYYDSVQKNSGDFLSDFKYEIFPVTQNNYRQILRSKSMDGYKEFFELNYLN
ncbi:MAG: tetratricopeptide repeat protein [Bacteroidetes bacterium]|nr:tetratricopeptide repeat protein [Bacteroidota bacterium]MDF1866310.1 tetratricopeptide repeat protein [Saprospiraceae bacterium]